MVHITNSRGGRPADGGEAAHSAQVGRKTGVCWERKGTAYLGKVGEGGPVATISRLQLQNRKDRVLWMQGS